MLQTRLASLIALALATAGPAEAHCRRAALTAGLDTPRLASASGPAAPLEPEWGAEPGDTTPSAPAQPAASTTKRDAAAPASTPPPTSPAPPKEASSSPPGDALASVPSEVPAPYTVAPGETLRTVLTRWAAASGWQLVWEAPNDYTLSATASFPGSLEQAATHLMEAVHHAGAPFGARMAYGNRVLRVTRVR
jgi:hypothetical protein